MSVKLSPQAERLKNALSNIPIVKRDQNDKKETIGFLDLRDWQAQELWRSIKDIAEFDDPTIVTPM